MQRLTKDNLKNCRSYKFKTQTFYIWI